MTDDVKDLLLGKGIHLGRLPATLASRYGARVAVIDPETTPGLDHGIERTFDEVEDATARFAAAHAANGVSAGDRVLILLDNRIDVVWHVFALCRLGAVPVPVNSRLKKHEVEGILAATKGSMLVADPDVVSRLRDDEGVGTDLAWRSTAEIADWVKEHPDERVTAIAVEDPRVTALLLCTSGTTGVPKAAALTSQGLLGAVGRLLAVPVASGMRSNRDKLFAALPLAHVMGLAATLGALCAGIPLLRRSRFDATETLDLIEEQRPNAFIGVPTMYADLEAAGAETRDLRSVQLWVSGADAMPAERARRFQRYGALASPASIAFGSAVFADVYGMVELSGAAAVRVFPPSPVKALEIPTMSVVLPGIHVRVVDDEGEPLGHGKLGNLQFKGGGVLSEYEGRPDAGPDADGWFTTGDLARVWPAGVFQLAGRTRDRLKVGGFSVFPAEVEESLVQHDQVAEVALVGVPDERLGERPVALVVRRGSRFNADAYLLWAREHVAGYRRPHAVHEVSSLPRGNNGKLDRGAATEQAIRLERAATSADA